jgi:hypothetical protein
MEEYFKNIAAYVTYTPANGEVSASNGIFNSLRLSTKRPVLIVGHEIVHFLYVDSFGAVKDIGTLMVNVGSIDAEQFNDAEKVTVASGASIPFNLQYSFKYGANMFLPSYRVINMVWPPEKELIISYGMRFTPAAVSGDTVAFHYRLYWKEL